MTPASTITDQVAQLHAGRAGNDAMTPFATEQAALATAGVPSGIAAIGSVVPDAELLDVQGAPTTLYAAAGSGSCVVVLYRGAWCPYCNIALATYQAQLLPGLIERGLEMVAISPQKPDGSLTMQDKNALTFAVLSDPGNTIAGALGVLTGPSDAVRAAQVQHGLDLTTANADGTTTLPMPTVAIIDAAHVLRWIDVHPDYSTRTEPDQILATLDTLAL
jgi:peroxiredoxin